MSQAAAGSTTRRALFGAAVALPAILPLSRVAGPPDLWPAFIESMEALNSNTGRAVAQAAKDAGMDLATLAWVVNAPFSSKARPVLMFEQAGLRTYRSFRPSADGSTVVEDHGADANG